MNRKWIKWAKMIVYLLLTILFAYGVYESVIVLRYGWGTWIVNRDNVQDRAYEALAQLYFRIQLLVFFVILLLCSLWALIHVLRTNKRVSIFARMAQKYRFYPALLLFVVFLVLTVTYIICLNNAINTPEISEVPASMTLRITAYRISIAALLMGFGSIIMFVSWLRNRPKKKTSLPDEEKLVQKEG